MGNKGKKGNNRGNKHNEDKPQMSSNMFLVLSEDEEDKKEENIISNLDDFPSDTIPKTIVYQVTTENPPYRNQDLNTLYIYQKPPKKAVFYSFRKKKDIQITFDISKIIVQIRNKSSLSLEKTLYALDVIKKQNQNTIPEEMYQFFENKLIDYRNQKSKSFANFLYDNENNNIFENIDRLVNKKLEDLENVEYRVYWTDAMKELKEIINYYLIDLNYETIPPKLKADNLVGLAYYKRYLEPVIKKLISIYLIHSEYFGSARHLAIETCEKILLIHNPSAEVVEKVYYALANLHSKAEDEWRREPYKLKLAKTNTNLYSQAQKNTDPNHSGMMKFIGYPENSHNRITDVCSLNVFDIKLETDKEKPDNIDCITSNDNSITWDGIKDFSIVTGINGIGKTKILASIDSELKNKPLESQKESEKYHLYSNSESDMLRHVFGQKGKNFRIDYIYEKLAHYLDLDYSKRREEVTKNADRDINCKIALALADTIFCLDFKDEIRDTWKKILQELKAVQDSSLTSKKKNEEREKILNPFIDENKILETAERLAFVHNAIIEPISFAKNICYQHLKYIKETYKADYNSSPNAKAENDKAYDSDISKYCKNNHGIQPPVENINAVLQTYLPSFTIKYQYIYNKKFRLINNEKELIIDSEIGLFFDKENEKLYYKIRDEEKQEIITKGSNIGAFRIDETLQKFIIEGIGKTYGSRIITFEKNKNTQLIDFIEYKGDFIGSYEFTFYKNGEVIHPQNLSSGELVAIKLILWSYVSKGLNFKDRRYELSASEYQEVEQFILSGELKPRIADNKVSFKINDKTYKITRNDQDLELFKDIISIIKDYSHEETKDPEVTDDENNLLIAKLKLIHFPPTKLKLLLLDEVDKHFDPELSRMLMKILQDEFVHKNGKAQIIMTTHRLDTIAQIPQTDLPKIEIFTIKQYKKIFDSSATEAEKLNNSFETYIVPTTKLEAMYRLTKNLREFTGHRFEVCTESTSDANFYSGVYSSLQMSVTKDYRVKVIKDPIDYTLVPKNLYACDLDNGNSEIYIGRALSNRYQLFFRGVSLVKNGNHKGDGGCSQIIGMIGRDYTSAKYGTIYNEELFANKEFHVPYGIVDADARCFEAPKDIARDDDEKYIKDRIVYPYNPSSDEKLGSRYSIENFLFDPLVLCSTLGEDEIKKFIDNSVIPLRYKNKMNTVCNNIKESIKSYQILQNSNIQTVVDEYFDIVFETILGSVLDIKFNQFLPKLEALLGKDRGNSYYNCIKQDNSIIKEMVFDILGETNHLLQRKSTGIQKVSKLDSSIREFFKQKDCQVHHEAFSGEVEYHMTFDKNNFDTNNSRRPFVTVEKRDTIRSKLKNPLKYKGNDEHWEILISEVDIIDSNTKPIKYKREQKEVLEKIIKRKVTTILPKKTSFIFKFDKQLFLKKIEYPEMFLQFRGHYLENYCFGHEIADIVAIKIKTKGLDIIPLDLAQIFFDLNQKIRTNVRKIIKPKTTSNKKIQTESQEEKNDRTSKDTETDDIKKDSAACDNFSIVKNSAGSAYDDAWTNTNLRVIEKSILFKLGINQLQKSLLQVELFSKITTIAELLNCDEYSVSLEKKIMIPISLGAITLIAETNHILNHENNVYEIIKMLGHNEILSDMIICLERKQHGSNLGMLDIAMLAKILQTSGLDEVILPSYIQKLPIYHDAILYNSAKAKGIPVIGIEGKNLAHSKESPYYHQAREEYMVEQLVKITKSGKNAIFLVGAAHTRNLIKLLGVQGFRVDNSDVSLGKNLITLKPEHEVGNNYQLEIENIVHEASQSYSFLSYIHEFAEKIDLNWQVQKLLHLTDLWKFEVLKAKYKITASFDIFKETNSNFIKSVLFKLHPDKNPGIKDCNEDFAFVINLREELNKPFDIQKLLNDKIQAIQPYIYKANIGFKAFDTAIDVIRLTYAPTVDNAKKVLIDSTYLYSMYSGINGISTIINGVDIAYKACQGEYSQALTQGLTTAGYMLVPAAISFVAIPHIGFVYGAALTVYSGYGAISNSYSFYQEYYEENFGLRSFTAYKNLYYILSNSSLQSVYDFASTYKNYALKQNNLQLEKEKTSYKQLSETKGDFGEKLYDYIYAPMLEAKYGLLNKIIQGDLTAEEAEALKAKHLKLNTANQSYDHCIEIVELKEEDSNHYYCYNEKQQILNHIVIIGDVYVEKISSL